MPTKKWTEEEEEFLRANFMAMTNAELAEKFDITKNAVQKKLARMDLRRSETMKQEPLDEISEADNVVEKETEMVSTESHFSLGNKLFYEDRNYKQALEEYRKAAKEKSDELIQLKARYLMAECYAKTRNLEEAMKIFKAIAKKHESHYLGDSAMRRIKALSEYM